MTEPEKMKVAELRAALQEKGLDTKGTKPVLVARLQEALAAEQKNPTPEPEQIEDTPMDEVPAAEPEETEETEEDKPAEDEKMEEETPAVAEEVTKTDKPVEADEVKKEEE